MAENEELYEGDDIAQISARLQAPFPELAIQHLNGMAYVEGHTVKRRLINATGNQWDWRVTRVDHYPYGFTEKKPDGTGGNARIMIMIYGELTVFGLGTRTGAGVQVVTAERGGEDMWKGANTDALKNAATMFGVALDLYGADYEAGEMRSVPSGRTGNWSGDSRSTKATQKQKDYIRTLQGERKLANSRMLELTAGKTLDELSASEASDAISKLQGMAAR